jgi:GTP-binding protein
MSRPVVAIVGRPNVGKSSLFNRLLGRKKALVQDTPGVTRDRNYAVGTLLGRDVLLVDTGGFEETGQVASQEMARLIRQQALVAVEEADVVVFVMDIRAGLLASDEEVAARLRTVARPVLVALNKADNGAKPEQIADFYRIGVGEFFPVSAEHGWGVGDLVEAVVARLPDAPSGASPVEPWAEEAKPRRKGRKEVRRSTKERHSGGRVQFLGDDMVPEPTTDRGPEPESWDHARGQRDDEDGALLPGVLLGEDAEPFPIHPWEEGTEGDAEGAEDDGPEPTLGEAIDFTPRLALLGRPNVGKSTLMNRLLGYQRSITSPVAGTTRDTIDACLEHDGRRFVLIDTAGVRRRARIDTGLERLTAGRSIRVIEAAHIVLLVVDAVEGVTEQEAKLAALAVDRGRAVIVIANKWDQMPKGEGPRRAFQEGVRRRFPHLAWADTVFLSALTGKGLHRLWEAIDRANHGHCLRVKTALLNRWLRPLVQKTPPPMDHHHPIRLYYASQIGIRPPTFTVFCSKPEALPPAWRRFVERELRATFPATGSPIRLFFRSREGESSRSP